MRGPLPRVGTRTYPHGSYAAHLVERGSPSSGHCDRRRRTSPALQEGNHDQPRNFHFDPKCGWSDRTRACPFGHRPKSDTIGLAALKPGPRPWSIHRKYQPHVIREQPFFPFGLLGKPMRRRDFLAGMALSARPWPGGRTVAILLFKSPTSSSFGLATAFAAAKPSTPTPRKACS